MAHRHRFCHRRPVAGGCRFFRSRPQPESRQPSPRLTKTHKIATMKRLRRITNAIAGGNRHGNAIIHPPARIARWLHPHCAGAVLALAALFALAALNATAAITFDAASTGSGANPASSVSWSHPVGSGNDRMLLVGVVAERNADQSAASGSKTDGDNEFTLDYSMTAAPPPFSVIGTRTGVVPDTPASVSWAGLTTGTPYEWYAVASDGSLSTTGATHTFTTAGNSPTPPTVTLGLTGSPLTEAGGTATVTATLSASYASDVTVSLAFAGTAALTTDCARSGASMVIPAGTTSGAITLTAVQDSVYENSNETIVVDIDTVVNGTESGTQQVTAIITDDDPAPATSAQYVIVISVDGLGGTYLSKIFDGTATGGPYAIPNFTRLKNEGASTLAAHCDNNNWETLPNHTSIITARPRDGAQRPQLDPQRRSRRRADDSLQQGLLRGQRLRRGARQRAEDRNVREQDQVLAVRHLRILYRRRLLQRHLRRPRHDRGWTTGATRSTTPTSTPPSAALSSTPSSPSRKPPVPISTRSCTSTSPIPTAMDRVGAAPRGTARWLPWIRCWARSSN